MGNDISAFVSKASMIFETVIIADSSERQVYMAILWKKEQAGALYEVRTAGNSRRLYTDGVFHSQYNPKTPLTRSVWDLLMLPAFFYSPGTVKRVLVLGVGGGAVIRLLQQFVAPQAITGVELNPVHLYVAKRFFKLGRDVSLHQADAIEWMQKYKGPGFDMIIDDLYGEQDGEPVRAVDFSHKWMALLLKHLNTNGVLVANFVSNKEFKQCAYFSYTTIQKRILSAFRLSQPTQENIVAAFLKKNVEAKILRHNLAAIPGLNPNLKSSRLRYHLRTIKPG